MAVLKVQAFFSFISHSSSLESFDYEKKKKRTSASPTEGLEFLPAEKKAKHVPAQEDDTRILSPTHKLSGSFGWLAVVDPPH
jgi:hypothetical protein